MKRIVALIMVILLLTLCGCRNNRDELPDLSNGTVSGSQTDDNDNTSDATSTEQPDTNSEDNSNNTSSDTSGNFSGEGSVDNNSSSGNSSNISDVPTGGSSDNPSSSGDNTPDNPAQSNADVWDGSVADGFDGGTGTANDPYRIASSAQLAFLAKSLNGGTSYQGVHFAITNDIDLNGIEWTPIGNLENGFEGIVEGNNHTISNLKITQLSKYKDQSNNDTVAVGGLFGISRDAEFHNLKIVNASVNSKIAKDSAENYKIAYVGILSGCIFNGEKDQALKIENVKVLSSSINVDNYKTELYAGGLVGYINVLVENDMSLNVVQSEVTVTSKNNAFKSYMGGMVGYLLNYGNSTVSDFACYSSINWPNKTGQNYAGAFGAIDNKDGKVKLSNAFSEITLDDQSNSVLYSADLKSSVYSYQAYAIIGISYISNDSNAKFETKNLFGCVRPKDNGEFTDSVLELYYCGKLTETNCHGCEELPINHGLSEKLWNLTSLKTPVLK